MAANDDVGVGLEAAEAAWVSLHEDYWRERVTSWARPDDYAGLARALLSSMNGGPAAAYEVLREGVERHPRAVAIWELLVLVASVTNRASEMDEALATIERLDPTSRVLTVVDQLTPDSAAEWAEQVDQTHRHLLGQLGSPDAEVRAAAVDELAQWARTYPRNSTYAINYALGLFSVGRAEEARQTALSAIAIEDGSFADAYNIGIVLSGTGGEGQGRSMLTLAIERAASAEERQLAAQALEEAG